MRAGDRTLTDFLDLFHHRLVSLFHRAWHKHRLAAQADRGYEDRLAGYLLALIGLGMEPLRGRYEFPDAALLFFAGPLAQQHHPAIMLEALVRDQFGLPVAVLPFQGRWLRLEPGDRSTLGSRHNQLGVSLVIGARVWDEQGQFRLRVGPLTFADFLRYQPDGQDFRALCQLTRLFVHGEFDFDLQLMLKAEEVPECQLTSPPGRGARLGRHARLSSRLLAADAEDAVFMASALGSPLSPDDGSARSRGSPRPDPT